MQTKPTATCVHAKRIVKSKWHYTAEQITDGCWSCSAVLTPAHLYIHENLDKIGMDEEERKRVEADPILLKEYLDFLNRPMWECVACTARKFAEIDQSIADGDFESLEDLIADLEDDAKRRRYLIEHITEAESCVPDCPDRILLAAWKKELGELQ